MIAIRNSNGTKFFEDGKRVFKNVCKLLILDQQQWIAGGQVNLLFMVDIKQSGVIPDVAAILTIPAEGVNESKIPAKLLQIKLRDTIVGTGANAADIENWLREVPLAITYHFLLTPYIKPKGNTTWILPKCMHMNTDFKQQALAFSFPSENDAQVFHNVFDSTYRSPYLCFARAWIKYDAPQPNRQY